jgi:hypothetical protein
MGYEKERYGAFEKLSIVHPASGQRKRLQRRYRNNDKRALKRLLLKKLDYVRTNRQKVLCCA